MTTFMHSGKAGDCIAGLSLVKQICAVRNTQATFILDCTGGLGTGDFETNEIVKRQTQGKGLSFPKSVCEYLKPLIEAQPYIGEVLIYDGTQQLPQVEFNLNKFRKCFLDRELAQKSCTNLEYGHYVAFGMPPPDGYKPWLTIPRPQYSVISHLGEMGIARTPRYTSAHVAIASMESKLAREGFFLGTEFEHKVFKETFGYAPKYVKTESALDAARHILGCDVFVANGTLMYWIAVGLGHKDILHELCLDVWTTFYKNAGNIRYMQGARWIK